ncbi:hypothetical protein NEUTE1DRAFT_138231 [Neurospora tetrasperma FGSC 2508]|uniref:DUF6604 domain-containing protein n=1 Tax=Neurospora tetrasperma (strain FGSC 2508 / ATCC MYA-4615 / P0657) TaxID=510951 RepID=F8MLZ7_NEUT8|nr:uncharacterized protein NEUTE1DRAFT_138231 [Neurospora tetrasperma FGSC 2508]EGO58512.1 hypothetical protein NEUTE1DRAFT_138231 [Neurospora tetrasperma FGSC 2508]EGZ71147.1 hypothetical protein NEUTE2DRAFT_166244 [Neurospora tetrasperma FGSC 2509]
MLPSNLIGIYAEYKRDTNAIASWLASSARICGYPTEKLSLGSWNSSPSTEAAKPTGRLKRKAREQAQQATSFTATSITPPKPYTLAVADFVPLAEFIVRSKRPAISVSPSVISILNRAISARSNFGQLLGEQQDTILDPQSDATHQHFVEVLEKVRKILLSKMPPAIPTADEVNGAQHLSNQFGLLRIQQPSLNVVDADPSIPKTEKKDNHPAAVQEDKTEYIAEEPSSRSDAVAAYCMLFQDITIIRGAVMDIWAGVRDGTTDYVAASIATDTAIGMIRDIADTMTSVMKPHEGIIHIMRLFHIVRCRTRGIDMAAVRFEDRENFLHDTYELALHNLMLPSMTLSTLIESSTTDRVGCCLSLLEYSDEDAIYGVGWDKDTRWLNLCVSECTVLAEGFEDDERLYPVRDMFVQGVQETMNTKVVPFYAIIAGQLNLDIHHVLGKKTKDVAREALRELSEIRKDVPSILDCHGEDSYLEHQLKLLNYVLSDPVKQVKDWSLEPGLPVAKAHQTLELLPVLTGQLVHHYRVAIYRFAIRIATVMGSIQYATQLYHALRTESLVKAEWPDLDHARILLGESSFYVGSLPKNIPEYMLKFSLQAGLSPAAKARQGRSKKKSKRQAREADRSQYTTAGPRMIADGDDRLPFSKKFIKLHESKWKKELEAWSRELLRDIIATVNVEPITLSKSEGNSWSSNSQEEESDSRLRCVLLKLAETLHNESRSLRFPLLKVHQSSWELLTTARDKCGPMLRAYFREPDFEDDELTWFITGYIFSAACRAHDKNRIGLPLKQSPDLRPLKMAGEVCERLLTTRRDFGTRALRWMEGGGQPPQQVVEDAVVGHEAIEDTCLNGTGVEDKGPGVKCHEITGPSIMPTKQGLRFRIFTGQVLGRRRLIQVNQTVPLDRDVEYEYVRWSPLSAKMDA